MTLTAISDSVVEEYRALRGATGLVDYPGGALLTVAGPHAAAFLGRVCTRGVDFLLEGQISSVLLLAEDGTVTAEALVHCRGTEYLMQVWPEQAAAARDLLVAAAAAESDVTVTDDGGHLTTIGIEGPESFKIIQKFLAFPVASMAYRSFVTVEHDGSPLLISRTGVTGEYGYVIHVPTAAAGELRAELIALGAREISREAVDVCRMETRFVNLEKESGGAARTPFELGLQWMVDANQEFTGKDAIFQKMAAGTSRLPVCFETTGDLPAPGTPVTAGDTEIGEVAYAVFSPTLERVVGVARVDTAVAASGLELTAGGAPARTVSAPFLVATSFGIPLE
ncbi:glycine cleavage T C-terminal barrel domain-containing protein [Micromonospora sp. DT31]|uniref:glycine cleavage T C-terminal barrel domain-containing protein n=1 Tax=Micromonospora sp. DT31 TaxID=3393434 RepID=UPI003CE78B39